MSFSRREFMGLGVGAAAWACAREAPKPRATPPNGKLSVTQVSGDTGPGQEEGALAIGDRRLAFAMFTSDRRPFEPPDVTAASVQLTPPGAGPLPPVSARVEHITLAEGGKSGTEAHRIFVLEHAFDKPGNWSLDAQVVTGGQKRGGTFAFAVLERSATVMPGQKAIASQSPTVADHRGVEPICTRTPQCSMHDLTIAQALASRKPVVIAFATPRYCTSRTCGPVVDIVENAKKEHGAAASFVHVEVWKSDESVGKETAPAFAEWKLGGEPWLFFVGADGLLKARWNGAVGAEETKKAVAALVAGAL